MQPKEIIERYHDAIAAHELSDDELKFLDHAVECSPDLVSQNGRRIDSLQLSMIDHYSADEAKEKLDALIARGVVYVSPNQHCVALVPFLTKAEKEPIRCVYCRKRATRSRATKDHVVPVSQGGSDDDGNMVDCCRDCNIAKGNRTPSQWAAEILSYRKHMPHPISLRSRAKLWWVQVSAKRTSNEPSGFDEAVDELGVKFEGLVEKISHLEVVEPRVRPKPSATLSGFAVGLSTVAIVLLLVSIFHCTRSDRTAPGFNPTTVQAERPKEWRQRPATLGEPAMADPQSRKPKM